ncbi:MAG: YsnF/AvaK domain-containing protein [Bacillota bacterium]
MAKSVIGFFDNMNQAQNTVQDLVRGGFRPEGIDTISREEADRGIDLMDRLSRYGVPADDARLYQEGLRQGGTLVALVTDDAQADEAANIMNTHGAKDVGHLIGQRQRMAGAAPSAQPTAHPTTQPVQGEAHIPVVEEKVKIGKREVETGGVRVSTQVSEKPVEQQVRLHEEQVKVERRPVDRPASTADISKQPGETIEVRETREEPVVQKEARVVEEVVVSREAQERTETIHEKARRQDVQVEKLSESDYAKLDPDFRSEFQRTHGTSGGTYDEYAPAYRYGFNLFNEDRYRGKEWSAIEPDVRRDWEQRHPGSSWDRFKDAIRYSWDRVAHGREARRG